MEEAADLTTTMGFVEDGAMALAPAEPGRAYDGHSDRQDLHERRWAAAQIEHYAEIDCDGAWIPRFVDNGSMDHLARQLAELTGRVEEDAMEILTERLIDIRRPRGGSTSPEFLGAISLDLNPEGRWPQDRGHPSAPQVVFYEIRQGSMLYDGESRRAMAVWFQPEVDDLGFGVNVREHNGRFYCNDFFGPGYLGVVDFYASRKAAKEALAELRSALKVLNTPQTADEPDPVRDSVYADDEAEDRSRLLKRKSQPDAVAF
jgi:hypothetical protein